MLDVNHFFGLSMATRFIQPEGGLTSAGAPMTYFFSGDDDALIYIDGVLVGDLSGIHDALSIKIDFQTGDVEVRHAKKNTVIKKTTLYDCYKAALGEDKANEYFTADHKTFKTNTVHTLKFFYLERGNLDSNLALEYNLVEVPESGVMKIDQDGGALAGASFELIATDKDYNVKPDSTVVATGTTDETGTFPLVASDGRTLVWADTRDLR